MPSIIELVNNQPGVVQRAIDLQLSTVSSTGEVYRDGYPDPALNRFFPFVQYSDPILALLKLRSYTPTVGYVVATDGDIPKDSERITVTQETFGNFKLAKSRLITEEDFIVARQAEQLALTGNGQAAEAIRNMFLAVPAMLTQSLINLHTVMSLQVACTGACNYADPVSGITANLSYIGQIPNGNLASALTGSAIWSNWVTANGITDIVNHMNDYYNNLKKFPPFIVMSRKTANDLRNQNSTKAIVARNTGVLMEVGAPDAAAVGQLPPPSLEAVSDAINKRLIAGGGQYGTTQIIVSDAFYYQRGATVSGTQTLPYIPANHYFFATDNYIERAIVPTASNNFAGGLVTTTEIVSKEPPQEKITVAGRGFPLVPDPRFIGARKVEVA